MPLLSQSDSVEWDAQEQWTFRDTLVFTGLPYLSLLL